MNKLNFFSKNRLKCIKNIINYFFNLFIYPLFYYFKSKKVYKFIGFLGKKSIF
ncbi:hypothetical protein mhp155 [Mesomycoplasma hyopneumoniae 232]|uniref:Uncharacterized protein n=1 Tax=Mesomycoplasma hyopneumoniae (strain 232) TaxID=295358 RepID=Q601P6_MESH2|nr:hypothetical protein mhp155 [Mesomycoplasma hyopneumoniae 232]